MKKWSNMTFTDVCYITSDVPKLRTFYEAVFRTSAEGDETHSWLNLPGLTFTFDNETDLKETPVFGYVEGRGSNNVIVGFNVEDVDAEYERLLSFGTMMLNEPTTHPWGARSFQFKDPDGNILNFRSFPKGNIMNDDETLLLNINKIHTTKMGIDRIKKNLELDTKDVVEWCKDKIKLPSCSIIKQGKNYYVTVDDCVITVNSHNYTIITAHKIKNKFMER